MFTNTQVNKARALLEALASRNVEATRNASLALLDDMFGAAVGETPDSNGVLRYRSIEEAPDHVPYWGLLNKNATTSGVYENFSLVAFPGQPAGTNPNEQILLCFGIGTGGVTEDADRLRLPWVGRYARAALCFLRRNHWTEGNTGTFAKDDLADDRTPIDSASIDKLGSFASYDALWDSYGHHLPTACVISHNDDNGAKALLVHMLLYGKFRGWRTRANYRTVLDNQLLPALVLVVRGYPKITDLVNLVRERRFVILQGPPGTGKTHLALKVAKFLSGEGISWESIQLHSSYGYDDFVEGFRPDSQAGQLRFKEHEGPLVTGLRKASEDGGHVLVVDEINRGDLSRTLGEAIFLLEPGEQRSVVFRSGKSWSMPKHFYLIGTMNTADRSIALLDFAIRRRFAFVDVWPSTVQLEEMLMDTNMTDSGKDHARKLFAELQSIFFEHASEEDVALQPGHAYFCAATDSELQRRLKYELAPLLREYLQEGRLALARHAIARMIDQIVDV